MFIRSLQIIFSIWILGVFYNWYVFFNNYEYIKWKMKDYGDDKEYKIWLFCFILSLLSWIFKRDLWRI